MPDEFRHISDMVVNALVEELGLVFEGMDDVEVVGLLRAGRLQQNPVSPETSILVHMGDPNKPDDWIDSSLASRVHPLDRSQISIPAFEIGGGSMWWRRFAVEVRYFGIKSKPTRDEARRIAKLQCGRVELAISKSKTTLRLTDSLGEQSILILPVSSYLVEGGGPPKSFVWSGIVRFQVLTGRPY